MPGNTNKRLLIPAGDRELRHLKVPGGLPANLAEVDKRRAESPRARSGHALASIGLSRPRLAELRLSLDKCAQSMVQSGQNCRIRAECRPPEQLLSILWAMLDFASFARGAVPECVETQLLGNIPWTCFYLPEGASPRPPISQHRLASCPRVLHCSTDSRPLFNEDTSAPPGFGRSAVARMFGKKGCRLLQGDRRKRRVGHNGSVPSKVGDLPIPSRPRRAWTTSPQSDTH